MRINAPLSKRHTVSADGTELAYYVVGSGPKTWLMPPAMGAPLLSMKHVLERFKDDYTIVSWDQRGFYGSAAPRDPEAMRVEDHVRDMEAVVRAEKLTSFVLGGWSMAVQLSLEYAHLRPEHVRALVLISGPYERALANVATSPAMEAVAMAALRIGERAGPILNPLSRWLLGARGASGVLHRAGVVAERTELFDHVLAEFCGVDWGRYFTMTRHLHAHSAAAYLEHVRAPTLITSGTRDVLTPPEIAERMHRKIRGSELFVIPGATHYVVAELPDALTSRIASFLARVDGRGTDAVEERA